MVFNAKIVQNSFRADLGFYDPDDFKRKQSLMLLSEKPQYRNDQVDVSDPYQDSSSGQCQMWRERESLINTGTG